MAEPRRLVFDTNVLLSRLLVPSSVPARAVGKGLREGTLLASRATLDELADVLGREKFDRYVSASRRREFLDRYGRLVEMVEIERPVRACRDPKDDKFLELAVNGAADCVVAGDGDLLALHPFRGISIVTPAAYLAGSEGRRGS